MPREVAGVKGGLTGPAVKQYHPLLATSRPALPISYPFSLGLPLLLLPRASPSMAVVPRTVRGSGLGAGRAASHSQPLGRAPWPKMAYQKGPQSVGTLHLEVQFGAVPRITAAHTPHAEDEVT